MMFIFYPAITTDELMHRAEETSYISLCKFTEEDAPQKDEI